MSARAVDVQPFKPDSKWKGNRPFARSRHKPILGEMNSTERAYANRLCLLELDRQVLWWKFEAIKFRLADSTFYTPDFAVMLADGTVEIHEVKGFWEDDARVKIKVAAELYPFRFRAFRPKSKKEGGGWHEEAFGPNDSPAAKDEARQLSLSSIGTNLDTTA
ncbi:MAG: hypothetical protein ACREJD_09465 [Phycisphaerales bacterium]